MQDVQRYWKTEGLDQLVSTYKNPERADPYYTTAGKSTVPFEPEVEDLVRIHQLIRERKSFTVLEFGVGFSTIIIADALAKNEREFRALPSPPKIRNRFLFELFSVDADEYWISKCTTRIPTHLAARVHLSYGPVHTGTFNGHLCHFYDKIPNVIPDFIYLDGPAPKDVQGSVNGLDFSVDERTVMSGDLLLMESTFLPGTFILVDGRINNVRFLQRNFQREYKFVYDPDGDISTFELTEPRLGKYNILGLDLFPS